MAPTGLNVIRAFVMVCMLGVVSCSKDGGGEQNNYGGYRPVGRAPYGGQQPYNQNYPRNPIPPDVDSGMNPNGDNKFAEDDDKDDKASDKPIDTNPPPAEILGSSEPRAVPSPSPRVSYGTIPQTPMTQAPTAQAPVFGAPSNPNPPAPYCRLLSPIDPQVRDSNITGAAAKGAPFTDGKDDSTLNYLKALIDGISDPTLKGESQKFSRSINNVFVGVNVYTRNVSARVGILTGKDQIMVRLNGTLNSQNAAQLTQVSLDRPDLVAGKFTATLWCIDENPNTCQNTIIMLEQISSDGKPCKRAYIVNRFGDAHLVVAPQDLKRYCSSNNPNFYAFGLAVDNTVAETQEFCQTGRSQERLPSFHSIGIQTWAVAAGPSFLALTLKSKSRTVRDVLTLSGFLLADFTEQSPQTFAAVGYGENVANGQPTSPSPNNLVNTLSSVSLLENSGKGDLQVNLTFKGSPAQQLQLVFRTLVYETRLRPVSDVVHP